MRESVPTRACTIQTQCLLPSLLVLAPLLLAALHAQGMVPMAGCRGRVTCCWPRAGVCRL